MGSWQAIKAALPSSTSGNPIAARIAQLAIYNIAPRRGAGAGARTVGPQPQALLLLANSGVAPLSRISPESTTNTGAPCPRRARAGRSAPCVPSPLLYDAMPILGSGGPEDAALPPLMPRAQGVRGNAAARTRHLGFMDGYGGC
jgi:hypothetical protein